MFPAVGGILKSAAFVGAYDDIPNLAHLYAWARRGRSDYEGNLIDVYRDSDGEIESFGYDSNGLLDEAAITAWLSGATPYADKVYDQIGGNDVSFTNRPLLVLSGQNGRPVLRTSGSNSGKATFSSTLSQPTTVYAGAVQTSLAGSGSKFIVDGSDGSNRNGLFASGLSNAQSIFAGVTLSGEAGDTEPHLFVGQFNGASSQLWRDGSLRKSGNAGTQSLTGVTIGNRNNGGAVWPGDIFMIAVANPAHDDDERFAMETAINDFWGIFRFRINLISRSADLGTAATQGVAYDGTYYYFMADDTIYRYTRSGSTYTLDTSQDFGPDMPGGTQINSMNIHDGYIWAGVSNFGIEPKLSWIMQIDVATFTFVANYDLDDAQWTEGGAWHDVGAGDDFWAVFHDWDRVSRYRFVDDVWTKIADYELPLAADVLGGLYQGAVWYNDGTDDYLVTQTHNTNTPPETHFHRWTGTGFEAAGTFPALGDDVGQGIHWETEGSVLLFAERASEQTIIRATLTDGGA